MDSRHNPAPSEPDRDAAPTVVERVARQESRLNRGPARWLPRNELAISLGAVLGASARFTVSTAAGQFVPLALPLGTLLVNLLGCFLIGVMQTLFLDLVQVRREVQLFVSVGFLGGLTTLSTVSVETVRLVELGQPGTALLYQVLSLVGGVLAALVGIVGTHLVYQRISRSTRR